MASRFLIVCWLISAVGLNLNGQEPSKMPVFPDDWLGVWQGELQMYKGQNVVQTVFMRVDNLPTDTSDVYIWALTYGEDTIAGKRNYLLRPMDKSKGLWETDEQNSIKLEGRVIGNAYVSVFTVANNTLLSKMSVENNDEMIFEIIVYSKDATSVTGNGTLDGEKIPEVASYTITGYQKAMLKKIR